MPVRALPAPICHGGLRHARPLPPRHPRGRALVDPVQEELGQMQERDDGDALGPRPGEMGTLQDF